MKALIFALIGLIFWGIAPLFGKIGLVQTAPGLALFIRSATITAILLVWLVGSGQAAGLAAVPPRGWLFIGLEGVCASLLGHLAYYTALKAGEVSVVSPIMASFPVVTVLLAFLLLGEKYTPGKLLGTLLIVVGVFLVRR
ncbi:MAG: EamA family transporter [Firmicutes bacterium]|nr:EamA family transporter [Bacillota bacterium]